MPQTYLAMVEKNNSVEKQQVDFFLCNEHEQKQKSNKIILVDLHTVI